MAILLLDESLAPEFARPLEALGHAVHTAKSEGLLAAPDEVVADRARKLGAILVTPDRDFSDIRASPNVPGIVMLRASWNAGREELLGLIVESFTKYADLIATIDGNLITFDARRARVREKERSDQ